jgi:hypothetical protein
MDMARDGLAGEPWVSAPLLGHLPGDPGSVPLRSQPSGEGQPTHEAPAPKLLVYGVVIGTAVLVVEVVLALAAMV